MIRNTLLSLFFTSSLFSVSLSAQEEEAFRIDRFADISTTEESFTVGNVAARMIEGLGFRYYWATEGLLSEDLSYRPSESGRTTLETINHIHELSEFMLTFLQHNPANVADKNGFEKLRVATLLNFELVESKLKGMSVEELNSYRMGEVTFWQFINGPVSDAIWHTGQVVMMRRASGNPIANGVNVLLGTKE